MGQIVLRTAVSKIKSAPVKRSACLTEICLLCRPFDRGIVLRMCKEQDMFPDYWFSASFRAFAS